MSNAVGEIQLQRPPVYVEWAIKDFFLYTEDNEKLDSPRFYTSETIRCWIRLYPNGKRDDTDYISLYLKNGDSNELYIACRLGIMKHDNSVFYSEDFDCEYAGSRTTFGSSRFLRRSDLLRSQDTVASDGVLRVFCIIRFLDNIDMTETACGTQSPKSLEMLTENFKDLYLGGRLCDVALTVKDKIFQAHKAILVARSPVFAAMFQHNMVESRSSAVNITDSDPNSFEDFLLFLYTGKLENATFPNVYDLYETSNKYAVKELTQECVQFMEHNMSIETFVGSVLHAVKYGESQLLASAAEFFMKNAEMILSTVQWQMFLAGNPLLANDLFIKLLAPATERKCF